jgi:hypothetical protein
MAATQPTNTGEVPQAIINSLAPRGEGV